MQAEATTMEEVEAIFAVMRESFSKFGISRVAMWVTVDAKSAPAPAHVTAAPVNTTPYAPPLGPIIPADKYAISLSDYEYSDVTNMPEDDRHDALTIAVKLKGQRAVLSKLRFLAEFAGGDNPIELARRRIYEDDFAWALGQFTH